MDKAVDVVPACEFLDTSASMLFYAAIEVVRYADVEIVRTARKDVDVIEPFHTNRRSLDFARDDSVPLLKMAWTDPNAQY
ncbi:MAG: hypothetical protein WA755_09660 [Candidatus Acidiferrales bacterium]